MDLFTHTILQREKQGCIINKLHHAINMLHLTTLLALFFLLFRLGDIGKHMFLHYTILNGLVNLLSDDSKIPYCFQQLIYFRTNLSHFYIQELKITQKHCHCEPLLWPIWLKENMSKAVFFKHPLVSGRPAMCIFLNVPVLDPFSPGRAICFSYFEDISVFVCTIHRFLSKCS